MRKEKKGRRKSEIYNKKTRREKVQQIEAKRCLQCSNETAVNGGQRDGRLHNVKNAVARQTLNGKF
jgi:hypothetical protein